MNCHTNPDSRCWKIIDIDNNIIVDISIDSNKHIW